MHTGVNEIILFINRTFIELLLQKQNFILIQKMSEATLNERKQKLNTQICQFYEFERILGFHFSDICYNLDTFHVPSLLHRAIITLNAHYLLIKHFLVVIHYTLNEQLGNHVYDYIDHQFALFATHLRQFEHLKQNFKKIKPE